VNHARVSVHKGVFVKPASVMLLLLVFSITSLTLALAAARSFQEVEADKRSISHLMVAMSYLNMKIRQNDGAGSVHVRPNPSGAGQALVIREALDSGAYETWIYHQGGGLWEALVPEGDPVTQDMCFLIAEIDGFDVSAEQPDGLSPMVRIDLRCDKGTTQRELSLALALRSWLGPDP
jgi:hypothetical protein